ncbi:MAG: DUF2892 domain-containing protein [Candidatus Zixiibacteriota bacterium]|nr:MAG: DUF2892 domain-containing protein [candidate division Zixibacteria bacterium]
MNANVGGVDRAIRVILGIVILALGFYYGSWWGLVGLVPLGTGLFSRCGLYALFGISTCKLSEKPIES